MKARMQGWGRTLALVAIAGLLLMVQYRGWADSSRVGSPPTLLSGSFQTDGVTSNKLLTNIGKNNAIFGFSVSATSSNGQCGLYDETAKGGETMVQGVFIDEGGTATQWTAFQSNWPAPYRVINGLGVVVTAGTCIVYHEPITFPS